jgi:glycosyltransferase involved in cell wall biosynthesis
VLLVHHLAEWEDDRPRLSEWACLRLAHRVVTTSRTSAERLRHSLGLAAAACLPGGDRLPLYPRGTPEANRVQLLFVGTWTRRKGLLELLQALGRLANSPFHLTVVGDAARDLEYSARVRALLAADTRLLARVDLRGVVDDATLAELYARSDVLVSPTQFEGYGMALSEALRAGVGVLATDRGAVREAVGLGEHVLWLDSTGPEELAGALSALLGDRERHERMRQAATKRPVLSWERTADCFERCISDPAAT